MKSFKLPSLVALVALFLAPSLSQAAEIHLAVAPSIAFPKDLPTYNEEFGNFYGNNLYILNSPMLRARAEAQLGQKTPASLQVEATQIPRTSILSIMVTGVDDSIAASFASALIDQFLKYKLEQKKKHYTEVIRDANSAISTAPKELVSQLTTYRDQLVMASLLDTRSVFEIYEF